MTIFLEKKMPFLIRHFEKMVDILVSSRGNHGAFFSVNTHTEWDQQTKFQLYNYFFRIQTFNDRTKART